MVSQHPKIKLITCGEPTENTGRTYPVELMDQVENMLEKNDGRLPVEMHSDGLHIDLARVTHVITEVTREGNTMYAQMEAINHPEKAVIPTDLLSLSPVGTGKVDTDGVITEYRLTKISIIPATRFLH